ncbi:MAG: glycosyltransferase family 2 protein [Candidatus Sulfotelmatobacter sp.]
MEQNVHIIVLNWNGWRDTIECLESLLHLEYPNHTVVVCDNASSDDSVSKIAGWADGLVLAESTNPQLSRLVSGPYQKPIPYFELTREQAESGLGDSGAKVILIRNEVNLGFAGGNNVGLRFALANPNCQFCWILNNDTVVEPDSLSAMVRLIQKQSDVGLCGSLNLDYRNPKEVQAQGGMPYNRWTGRVPRLTRRSVDDLDFYLPRMDYVNGASMLASRTFLEKIGLMEESYFLYFEELDWAMRAKGKFVLGYARNSVIYHKQGSTIGSSRDRRKRSLLSEQYLSRNRVLFTRRFLPWALPTVLLSVCFAAAERLCRGDAKRATAMLSFMLRGLIARIPRTAESSHAAIQI